MKSKILRQTFAALSLGLVLMGCGQPAAGKGTTAESTPVSEVSQSTEKQETSLEQEESTSSEASKSTETTKEESSTEQITDTEESKTENTEPSQEEVMEDRFDITIKCPNDYLEKITKNEGELVRAKYYSTTCEKDRNVNILLPKGYSAEKTYPVLYFLHGIFGDENTMLGTTTAINNMIAEQVAEEMIVVYPYMYASKTQDACTGIDTKNTEAYDNFINDLVTDLMPYIKENYSIKEGKENTAIMGFSMGGRESLAIGLQRPDLFGYVCAIAPAPGLVPGKDWAMTHPGQFAEEEVKYDDEKPFFIFLCAGDSDKTVGTFPKSYHILFDKNQVEHTWWEIPGSDHGDPAISSGVYNFCKYVFKEEN